MRGYGIAAHGESGHSTGPCPPIDEASYVTSRRTSTSIRIVRRRRARHLLTPLRRPRPRAPRLARAAAPDASANPSSDRARSGRVLLSDPDRGVNGARRRHVAREIVARIAIPALCHEDEIPLPVEARARESW